MSIRKAKVLFVDDEINVLESLKRSLRPMRAKWDMSFALGGEEALKTIDQIYPDVVVSDMRMDGMSGLQLLQSIKENFPECIRIILSGYPDTQKGTLQSMQVAHQYLCKPCTNADIIQTVERVLSKRDMLDDSHLRAVVGRLVGLPSLPEIYEDIVTALNDENVASTELAAIVSRDVGMTATILRLVNSSLFGCATRISSIHRAVDLLGGQAIRVLVLSTYLFDPIDSTALSTNSIRMLWEHSWRVACFAKTIAENEGLSQVEIDESFVSGMMHDVGKIILASSLSSEYLGVLESVREENRPVHELELEILGTTHAAIGGYLLGLWGFTSSSLEAVGWHHAPDKQCCSMLTPSLVVHVANALDHDLVRIHEDYAPRRLYGLGINDDSFLERMEHWRSLCSGSLVKESGEYAVGIALDADV